MTTGYTFEQLEVGLSASRGRTVTEADVVAFAGMSGDYNPMHVDEEFASSTRFQGRIGHGMFTASLLSAVLGMDLPGPGAIYVHQTLHFKAPVRIGDTVTARVVVRELKTHKHMVVFDTTCLVRGAPVLTGEAVMMVPPRETAPAV
ncbi:3-hydroxybutyryl-CoA dehydratase [Natronocella acetinitrilica]|uniref:3-hydroxybutyryl-CoA dehydratase n=1 Tax=Natronocella acetinitrilica TaxID=414046 RepID=A0AAE3G064_9GAMM|nr:MaoC family dehydratase [Natronocella acetinitrilica]MCP1673051.1 3-hydroxybutyryl-CoA dehydratase [Natronocella acetinitrilica]